MSRRAAASSPAPSPPKGRRCPAAARPSSAPPWPRRSPAAGCGVQGVGNRVEREETALPFLGGRTSRLANLRRGATQGRPSRGAVRPGHPECGPGSFRAGRSGRGRGGRPLGGELPGQHLRGGPTPWTASRNSCSGRRKDPPSSSAAAPLHLLCFLLLPQPRFSADRRARFGTSLAAPVSPLLAAARPVGHRLLGRPLVAAPRVRARPGGGRCWEARVRTKPTAPRLPDLNPAPSTARGQGSAPSPTGPPTQEDLE